MLSELKYIIFTLVLVAGVPAGVILAMSSKLWERVIVFLMIFFTCNLMGTIHFCSHRLYRGTSRGFEITLVDLATLVLFFVIVIKPKYKVKLFPPGSLLYFLYLLVSIISIKNSANTLFSWFEVLSMVRMYFYFWVWYNYFSDIKNLETALKMLSIIIVFIFLYVAYDKRMGDYQPNGPFAHQNSMSMYMMVLGGWTLAMLCEVKMDQIKTIIVTILFGMCSAAEMLGLSRGGVVCYAGCCAVVIFFSFLVKYKARKMVIVILIGCVGFCGLLLYANAIYERFMYAPKSSLECRKNLATSAINMANDKFFGIGLNNFGVKVNAEYPYSEHAMPKGFKEGLVETIYLMVAAETGWMNLGIFILMLLYFFILNVINIFRYRRTPYVYIAVGIAGGLSAIYVQSSLEWVLKQTCNFYQMMFMFAIVVSMSRIYKEETKKYKKSKTIEQNNASNVNLGS